MQIAVVNDEGYEVFSKLSQGDVFRLPHSTEVFMKTEEIYEEDKCVNVVSLADGSLEGMDADAKVFRLKQRGPALFEGVGVGA